MCDPGNEDIKVRMKTAQDQLVRNERTLMTAWGRDAQKGLNAIHKLILDKKVPVRTIVWVSAAQRLMLSFCVVCRFQARECTGR